MIKDKLSPFELYTKLYQTAKDFKPYKEVNNGGNIDDSRNLSKLLFNEYIVCVGYANLLQEFCKRYNIETYYMTVSVVPKDTKDLNESRGHARLLVKMKDEKYGIDGLYVTDPTWDHTDNSKYNHILMTFDEINREINNEIIFNAYDFLNVKSKKEFYALANNPAARKKLSYLSFDIKEFVKAQKKKKLLEMMNAADNNSASGANKDMFGGGFMPPMGNGTRSPFAPNPNSMMGGASRPNAMPSSNPFAPSSGMMGNNMGMSSMPNGMMGMPSMPNGMMGRPNQTVNTSSSNPMGMPSTTPMMSNAPVSQPIPQPTPKPKNTTPPKDDGLGFDVDELVRKIDAKIAELEEEEKKNKVQSVKATNVEQKTSSNDYFTPVSHSTEAPKEKKEFALPPLPEMEKPSVAIDDKKEVNKNKSTNLVLDDDEDDDEFFDDFFDN